MATKQFDDLVTEPSAGHSRRDTLRGIIAGAVAGLAMASAAKTGDAGKAAKRRRRRRKRLEREEEERRQCCLDACGETCTLCFHTVSGDIVCTSGGDSICDPNTFCTTDDDCNGKQCFAAFQFRGASEIQPFGSGACDYPVGICSSVVACPTP